MSNNNGSCTADRQLLAALAELHFLCLAIPSLILPLRRFGNLDVYKVV